MNDGWMDNAKDKTGIQIAVERKNNGFQQGSRAGEPPLVVVIAGDFKGCEGNSEEVTITLRVPGLTDEDITRIKKNLTGQKAVVAV